jgi:TRAP-type transport system periplasmic protein
MIPFRASRQGFITGSSAALATIGIVRGTAKAAQFEFTCGSGYSATHPSSIRLTQMFSAIERQSGGRIHTQFFPNSQLGGDAAMLTQLRAGAMTFYIVTPGNLAPVIPAVDITNLGMVFSDVDQACRVHDGPLGAYIVDEMGAKGIHAMRTMWDVGMAQVCSGTRPIATVADAAGFKMRLSASKMLIGLFESLGASPVVLSLNEVYTAMQTHLIDGCPGPLGLFLDLHYYEVAKYVSLLSFSFGGLWLVMNQDSWKRLPADLQNILERNNHTYALLDRNDGKIFNAVARDQLRAKGLIFNEVDQRPFRARLQSFYGQFSKSFSSKEWGLLEAGLGQKLT